VEIFSLVKQMEADGIEITSLCVGEPDYLPPSAVLESLIQAVQAGQTRYTALTGTLELRQAIAHDLQRRKGVAYDPKSEILVGNGAKQCVFQGIYAVAGAGDQVLVPAPHWPYPEMVKLTSATPVIVETQPEDGYLLTPEQLRRTLEQHSQIKLVIICNPSNPTGAVYNQEQLAQLAQVLHDFPHVKVLADEIYERLVYSDEAAAADDDARANVFCFAALPGMWDRTIIINGFSKSHAMTGMRLGYLAAPAPLCKAATTIQSQLTSCAGSLSQAAGVAALTKVHDSEIDQNVQIMKAKRDYVLQRLSHMQSLGLLTVNYAPRGAFYVLPDVSGICGDQDGELCVDLLQSARLALVPGSGFGAPGTVRISYATGMDVLVTAMDKLETYLTSKKQEQQQQQ